jgi:hypothetical protein
MDYLDQLMIRDVLLLGPIGWTMPVDPLSPRRGIASRVMGMTVAEGPLLSPSRTVVGTGRMPPPLPEVVPTMLWPSPLPLSVLVGVR